MYNGKNSSLWTYVSYFFFIILHHKSVQIYLLHLSSLIKRDITVPPDCKNSSPRDQRISASWRPDGPIKPPEHHSSMASRGLKGALNCTPIMRRGSSLFSSLASPKGAILFDISFPFSSKLNTNVLTIFRSFWNQTKLLLVFVSILNQMFKTFGSKPKEKRSPRKLQITEQYLKTNILDSSYHYND